MSAEDSAESQIREVTFQEGYAIWAASYDSEKNALIVVEESHVNSLLDTLPITTALDVGTGTGRYALKLARRGATVTAIDQSPEMLALAQNAACAEGLTIDFQLASLDNDLPFASDRFDFLICTLMLCHVPNLVHAIQEFYRVLQPGGHLLITAFHPEAIERGWRTMFRRPEAIYFLPNMLHTRADYLDALAATGFTVLKVIDALLNESPEGYISEALLQGNADMAFCLIVLAQKPL